MQDYFLFEYCSDQEITKLLEYSDTVVQYLPRAV